MKIICEDHGAQNGILASRDMIPFVTAKKPNPDEHHIVRLSFKDGAYDEYLLSKEFCNQNNIHGTALKAESDEFPMWCSLLSPICIKCAEKIFQM